MNSLSAHSMRVHTKHRHGGAVEIRKIGIHDRSINYAAQQQALSGLVVPSTVQSGSIDDNVICGACMAHQHEVHNFESRCLS
jgi:hypothetical protein